MDGPNVNVSWDVLKLHSSYREQNEFSRLINFGQLWPSSCITWCPANRTDGSRLEINKALHVMWKILMNHLQREIFISGKLVVMFFLCIFARPDGLRIIPFLHEEFRCGQILSSTGFHCQEVNVHIISHLIPWSSAMQIN